MVKIALLISGRITRYDVCLLETLEQSQYYHEIDLFLSINSEYPDCEYFSIMKETLKPWLKRCVITKYEIPDDIFNLFNPNETTLDGISLNINSQNVNNKFVPYNTLSMYYNDNMAFKMACYYADINNFEYDCYMKFRSDIVGFIFPLDLPIETDKETLFLFSVVPNCNFISQGLFKKPIISDVIIWGNRKSMNIYCNTYNYVLKKINLLNGKYLVATEICITDNIYENDVEHTYINYYYRLDANRRMFDTLVDSRLNIAYETVNHHSVNDASNIYINTIGII